MRASCWILCLKKSAITFGEGCRISPAYFNATSDDEAVVLKNVPSQWYVVHPINYAYAACTLLWLVACVVSVDFTHIFHGFLTDIAPVTAK